MAYRADQAARPGRQLGQGRHRTGGASGRHLLALCLSLRAVLAVLLAIGAMEATVTAAAAKNSPAPASQPPKAAAAPGVAGSPTPWLEFVPEPAGAACEGYAAWGPPSADARFVLLGDGCGARIWRHDRATSTDVLVNVNDEGEVANEVSTSDARLSSDGRLVAFTSWATNLITGVAVAPSRHVYVRDVVAATTREISVAADGASSNGDDILADVSGDGRYVFFTSTGSNLVPGDIGPPLVHPSLLRKDLQTGAVVRVDRPWAGGVPDGEAGRAAASDDGAKVVFTSRASNLVRGVSPDSPYSVVFLADLDSGRLQDLVIQP